MQIRCANLTRSTACPTVLRAQIQKDIGLEKHGPSIRRRAVSMQLDSMQIGDAIHTSMTRWKKVSRIQRHRIAGQGTLAVLQIENFISCFDLQDPP